jgi:hypothetical protein
MDGYHVRYAADADWIRELARQQGAWANIPLKRNRKDPILSVFGMRPRHSSAPDDALRIGAQGTDEKIRQRRHDRCNP